MSPTPRSAAERPSRRSAASSCSRASPDGILDMTSGAFVRQQSRFRGRPARRPRAPPPLRRARVPVVAARGDRPRRPRRSRGSASPTPHPYRDERGWAFTGGRFTDEVNGFELPRAGLPRDRPRLRRPRQRPRPVGQGGRPDRLQRVGRHRPHLQRVGRRRPLPGRAARGDRRAQRVDLRRVPERRLPRRLRALPGGLRRGLPRRVRRARAPRGAPERPHAT